MGKPELVWLALDPDNFTELLHARQVLVPGEKHPRNPVLRPRPGEWDGTRCKVYGTVLFDPSDQLFKMWYSGGNDVPDAIRREHGARRHVGYAYSTNGVDWERPSLGLIEYGGSKRNNLVLLNGQAPCVFIQEHEPNPDKRFLMLTETGQNTHHTRLLYSADGLNWSERDGEPISSSFEGRRHEPFSILYDPEEPDPDKRWKGYSLLHVNRGSYFGRAVGLFLGSEPGRWVEYDTQPILSADDGLESEIHLPAVTRMYDTYVMLYDAMEPNHHTQTEVAVSRDGIRFQKMQNGVKMIPNGKPGQPDAGKVCVSPKSLFVHAGKIWFYCAVSADTYQTAPRSNYASPWYRYTALVQWRQDGMAYLGTDGAEGAATITTVPASVVDPAGWIVWLNAVAHHAGGGITVEALDASGRVLAVSEPWFGDRLRGPVVWNETPPERRAGQHLSLRLRLSHPDIKLYAVGMHGAVGTNRPAGAGQSSPAVVAVVRPAIHPMVRWTYRAEGKISGSPLVHEGTVYVGSWDRQLHAIDSRTGELRWKAGTDNAIAATPAVHGGKVFAGSRDGCLYAYDQSDGALCWKSPVYDKRRELSRNPNGAWIECSPTVGAYTCRWKDEPEAPQWIFVGAHDRHMHAFDPDSGTEKWRFPTFNWILSRPAIDQYRVIFGSLDGHIYALDAQCGALLWRFRVGSRLTYADTIVRNSVACEAVSGSPLVASGTVYCGADDGFLYALDAGTGQEKWSFQTDKGIYGAPALFGNRLAVASGDGNVYGLDASSGKRVWVKRFENAIYADMIRTGDRVLAACTSGRLAALDIATGNRVWEFKADAGLRAAPAAGPDGTVYAAACSGVVYALRPPK